MAASIILSQFVELQVELAICCIGIFIDTIPYPDFPPSKIFFRSSSETFKLTSIDFVWSSDGEGSVVVVKNPPAAW